MAKRILLLLLPGLIVLPDWLLPQEQIQEKVKVVNIEVPVRVFAKDKPVQDLAKEDFKILVDGKERVINGFYAVRKKIEPNAAAVKTAGLPPRLFTLIINITDYGLDFRSAVSSFFDTFMRANDRLLVISNNFVLDDRVISDPQKEKESLCGRIEAEQNKLKGRLHGIDGKVRQLAEDLARDLTFGGDPAEIYELVRQFNEIYLNYLRDYKALCLNLSLRQFIRLAGYLERQKLEKWVFSYCPMGVFPILKRQGRLERLVREAKLKADNRVANDPEGRGMMPGIVFEQMAQELDRELANTSYKLEDDLSKIFLNSEVTFHTMLMKPPERRMIEDFDLRPIGTDWEMAMRQLTQATGGSLVLSNKSDQFHREVAAREDIYYVLTFAPTAEEQEKAPVITVTVGRPDCRVLYDNQHYRKYVRRAEKAVEDEEEGIPQVKLLSIRCQDGLLSFAVSDYLTQETEQGEKGQVSVRVRVLDGKNQTLLDRKKDFTIFKGKEEITIKLDDVPAGAFSLVVEATDLLTGKSAVETAEIRTGK